MISDLPAQISKPFHNGRVVTAVAAVIEGVVDILQFDLDELPAFRVHRRLRVLADLDLLDLVEQVPPEILDLVKADEAISSKGLRS